MRVVFSIANGIKPKSFTTSARATLGGFAQNVQNLFGFAVPPYPQNAGAFRGTLFNFLAFPPTRLALRGFSHSWVEVFCLLVYLKM